MRSRTPCITSILALAVTIGSTSTAATLYDDAVFAYDMESVSGDSVENISVDPTTGTIAGTKWSTMVVNDVDPLADGEQHLRATENAGARINSNITLTASTGTDALSFSMFVRNNGSVRNKASLRLLSTFPGTGSIATNGFLFDALGTGTSASDPLTRLRFIANGQAVVVPDLGIDGLEDGKWHQIGFVFSASGVNTGSVQFYFDGAVVGSTQSIATAIVPAQGAAWHVYEDADVEDPIDVAESFKVGEYDNTGLWYRALTATEMQVLYTSAIPEPASMVLLGLGGALMLSFSRRRAS